METIKEALTFDDVTLEPKYSEILPSEVDTSIKLNEHLKLRIPILSSAISLPVSMLTTPDDFKALSIFNFLIDALACGALTQIA